MRILEELKLVAVTLWRHSSIGKLFVSLACLQIFLLLVMFIMLLSGAARAQEISCTTSKTADPVLTEGQFIMDERCPGDAGCETHKIVAVCEGGCHPDKTEPPPLPPPIVERDVPVRWEAPRGGTPVLNYMVNYSRDRRTWLQVWAGGQARTATIPKMEVGVEYVVQLFANGTDNVMSPPIEVVTVIKGQ